MKKWTIEFDFSRVIKKALKDEYSIPRFPKIWQDIAIGFHQIEMELDDIPNGLFGSIS